MENTDEFEVIRTIPAPKLVYGTPGTTYTLVRLPEDPVHGQFLWVFGGTKIDLLEIFVIVIIGEC